MAFRLPPLTVAQLKVVATQCGLATSGAKPVLVSRITDAVEGAKGQQLKREQRVLSIDMGIRNLAYSLLIPGSGRKQTAVQIWKRTALQSPLSDGQKDAYDADVWTPPAMAALTLSLVRETLLPLKPTHILIERQRYRTMGAGAVQEWTLRVNTLEAMIYAALATMHSVGEWQGEVIPMMPARVTSFWLKDIEDEELGKREAKKRSKLHKINIVGNWMKSGGEFKLSSSEAESTAEAYLSRWDRSRGGKRTRQITAGKDDTEALAKLDDLADSLLQGMAWLKWEENKERVLEQGTGEFLRDIEKST